MIVGSDDINIILQNIIPIVGGSPPTFIRKVDGVTINGSILNTLTLPSVQCDGVNKCLVVAMISYGAPATTVTFNTVESLSLHSTVNYYDSVGYVEIWRLIAPSNTTGNVVIVWSGSVNAAAVALVFNDVNQTTPLGAIDSASYLAVTPANVNLNVAPVSNTSDLVIDAFGFYANQTYTPGIGQIATATSALNDGNESIIVTRKVATAGTTTMSKTWSSNTEATLVGVAIKGL